MQRVRPWQKKLDGGKPRSTSGGCALFGPSRDGALAANGSKEKETSRLFVAEGGVPRLVLQAQAVAGKSKPYPEKPEWSWCFELYPVLLRSYTRQVLPSRGKLTGLEPIPKSRIG